MLLNFKAFWDMFISGCNSVFSFWKSVKVSGLGLVNTDAYTIIIGFLVLEILIPFLIWKFRSSDD